LSERFEKTYISVQEFITSWEKEVYELTNLDYFTFLLINHIGNLIENDYFNQHNKSSHLKIDPEHIATLSFNVGDSFESFLENNCFGDCSLSCPTRLNEKVSPDDIDPQNNHLHILQIVNGEDLDKRQFFLTDILNYVVLDTLFDFYNYEIGMDLDDADIGLMQFADYITSLLQKFIENLGQTYLKCPRESAAELFEKLIQENSSDWNEEVDPLDEESEDQETWKFGNMAISEVVDEYLASLRIDGSELEQTDRLLTIFKNYTDEYAGIKKIDDIELEDLEEFFLFWFVRELTLEREIGTGKARMVYGRFIKWLEISRDIELSGSYNKIIRKHYQSVRNSVLLARRYFEKNSIIDGLLAVNSSDIQIVDGLFEVERVTENGFLHLRDIHFKHRYQNVQINFPNARHLLQKNIFDASLKPTAYGWRLINLDYIFPQAARPYLH
jgi:hypothetical protein